MHGAIARAANAFRIWRNVPAPRRGEFVRLLGEELRAAKTELARLVTIEAGKITTEGLGEVQEMIDICDFAVGLSRQLHGLTIATERRGHRMMETWRPLGVVGVITSFNFPSPSGPGTRRLRWSAGIRWFGSLRKKLRLSRWRPKRCSSAPPRVSAMRRTGFQPCSSAGATSVKRLSKTRGFNSFPRRVRRRWGAPSRRASRVVSRESILELGGNNAAVVCASAPLDLAVRAIAFAAMGTAGQRCTTLRRLIVHEDVYDELLGRLRRAYASVPVGDPRDGAALVGPLIDRTAYAAMRAALDEARAAGGVILGGERVLTEKFPDAFYVRPALVEMPGQTDVVRRETFAPILYVMKFRSLDEAIELQ